MKKIKYIILLCLLTLPFSCKDEEVAFPSMTMMHDRVEAQFKQLVRIDEPEQFHEITLELIGDLRQWESVFIRLKGDNESYEDENLIRSWHRHQRHSYNMVVDYFVECYKLKVEYSKPAYYTFQDSILEDLDNLIFEINRFMILSYPMMDNDMAFYKNIPEITSRTSDSQGNLYYIINVIVGYLREERQTQTALNSSKIAMQDLIRSYCSLQTVDELQNWNELNLKAGLMKELNDYIGQFYDFNSGKMEGIKLVTISKLQTFAF
ncbi:MAG: hypothetical protein PF447_05090 [Spirochaetaceae bacterium]|nr:hypothetical protein [Spirochaetaceae bacterium]